MYIDTVDACMHVHISICIYIIINKWRGGTKLYPRLAGSVEYHKLYPPRGTKYKASLLSRGIQLKFFNRIVLSRVMTIGLHVVWMDGVELIYILIQWLLVCMFILVFACI